MRVIFFTKYTRKGASSRLRTYQYLEYFEKQNISCVVSPFFDSEYLGELYLHGSHNKWKAFQSFARRFFVLFTVFRYDKVVIEKELFPYFPAWPERLLSFIGVKYIADYDDAIWHNYDISKSFLIRSLLAKKIDIVMRKASAVIAGNDYIQQKAIDSGAKKVVLIPTVIDVEKYIQKSTFSAKNLIVGWIGSPITAKYLEFLKPVFQELYDTHRIRLNLVGAREGMELGIHERIVEWTERTEVASIRDFDIGIMPLEDSIWERGKCGYKLIQYMGCGLPVIGTPIGVNRSIIHHGENGFLATTAEEWRNAFLYFINDPQSLARMGQKGRALAEASYSLQRAQQKWVELLKDK